MAPRFRIGDLVQTPFGKGIVRDIENSGRLRVELQRRTILLAAAEVSLQHASKTTRPSSATAASAATEPPDERGAFREIDLHGLTVDEALSRIDGALNDALLANVPEVRFIHGRTGGRLRAALHQRLRRVSAVRTFRLDPRNAGVTIVQL